MQLQPSTDTLAIESSTFLSLVVKLIYYIQHGYVYYIVLLYTLVRCTSIEMN